MRVFTATVLTGLIPASVLVAEPGAGLPPDAERGRLQCSLTAWTPASGDVATADTLLGAVVMELDISNRNEAKVTVHRDVLEPIAEHLVRQPDAVGPYLRYLGRSITAENDAIVARFRDNGVARPSPHAGPRNPSFAGFKVYLGQQVDRDGGRDHRVDLYLRIIVDWSYQTTQHDRMSLHRAAFVISQVPIEAGAARERFYRFSPNQRPFRTLACVLADATST